MRIREEEGQAVVMVALAMGIFLIGAVGLGVDGSMLYSQRQKAQMAADSAAQAAMMSIFDGTYGSGSTAFTLSTFTCGTTDAKTPCKYASMNGFGSTASDTVTVSFPASSAAPGVALAGGYPANLVEVDVSRSVPTTLMRLLGPTATTIQATAIAAVVNVTAPIPILVVHPTMSGAFSTNGGVDVKICGGSHRSIEVNSSSTTASTTAGGGTVDLSKAGPPDPGDCSTGNGADFGVWGGPGTAPFTFLGGSTGKYLPAASWRPDPLANVSPPDPTTLPTAPTPTALGNGVNGCPASPKKACMLYYPGIYTGGIDGKNSTPVFSPGIYYIQSTSGMACAANCDMYMATGVAADSTTGTSWAAGHMLVYNTGPSANPSNAGPINLGANGSIFLTGSPSSSSYQGILFFQDRSSQAQAHSLGGGGALQLVGTIYLTNTRATMLGTPSHFQSLSLQGNPSSSTTIQGEIIVDALSLGGNAGITMNLSSTAAYVVSEVALVQ
jgi:hypothetical protein